MIGAKTFVFKALGGPYTLCFWSDVPAGADVAVPDWAAHLLARESNARTLDPYKLSLFASHVRFVTGGGLGLNTHENVEWLCKEILRRRVVAFRATGDSTAEDTDPLATAVQRVWGAFGSTFMHEGGSYRLVFAEAYSDVRQSAEYEPVRLELAQRILAALATRKDRSLGADTWSRVTQALSHPGLQQTGDVVFLLQKVRVAASRVLSSEPPVTPSALRKWVDDQRAKEKAWIEVQLVGLDAVGIAGCPVSVEDADGVSFSGTSDKDGLVRFEQVSPNGSAEIRFTQLPDRKGGKGKGTTAGIVSSKCDASNRLVVVPGGPSVEGAVNARTVCCLYQPVMTVAYSIHERPFSLEYPRYKLCSTDSRYQREKSPKDDLVPGDALLQIEFDELLVDAVYDLTCTYGEGVEHELFIGASFLDIVDQPRGDAFGREVKPEAVVSLDSVSDQVGWS